MNILPLKKWHVRRKENVERVRRDEAEAKAKEEELQRRAEIAEKEARLDLMKKRARERDGVDSDEDEVKGQRQPTPSTATKNINFFADLEQGVGTQISNAEHDAEKKAEQEKVEKRIGLLNYLVDKDKTEEPWYSRGKPAEESAKSRQRKEAMDPMNQMKEYLTKKKKADSLLDQATKSQSSKTLASYGITSLPSSERTGHRSSSKHTSVSEDSLHRTHRHKHEKNHKKDKDKTSIKEGLKSEKKAQLEKLRQERRRREEAERTKAEAMLRTHFGGSEPAVTEDNRSVVERPGRYFSQFNPHLARQQRSDH